MAIRKLTELSVPVKAQPGELARVLEATASAGVNVLAFCGYNEDQDAHVLLVPDKEQKARQAMASAGFASSANPVVAVTRVAGKGAGAKLCRKLAEAGVNIQYAYASTAGAGTSTAIFRVPDPDAAIRALKSK